MNLNPVYPKKRYVIEFIKEERLFSITSPDNIVVRSTTPWQLSKMAFDDGADEVVHNYDLGIVDSVGRLL